MLERNSPIAEPKLQRRSVLSNISNAGHSAFTLNAALIARRKVSFKAGVIE